MSGSITEMLIIGIAMLVVVVLILSAFAYVNMSKQQNNQSTDALASVMSSYDDPEKIAYNGTTVMGSEVIDLAKKAQNDSAGWEGIAIVVKTKSGTTKYYGGSGASAAASQCSSATLGTTPDNDINSGASFKCTVDRDGDDIIKSLTFIQSK